MTSIHSIRLSKTLISDFEKKIDICLAVHIIFVLFNVIRYTIIYRFFRSIMDERETGGNLSRRNFVKSIHPA